MSPWKYCESQAPCLSKPDWQLSPVWDALILLQLPYLLLGLCIYWILCPAWSSAHPILAVPFLPVLSLAAPSSAVFPGHPTWCPVALLDFTCVSCPCLLCQRTTLCCKHLPLIIRWVFLPVTVPGNNHKVCSLPAVFFWNMDEAYQHIVIH